MKNFIVASFCLFCLTSFGQNYWTLSGSDIVNNNTGLVGINQQNPVARLHINTTLLDYGGVVAQGDPTPCFTGTTGFRLTGRSWDQTVPNPTLSCSPFPIVPNLFEANIELGSSVDMSGNSTPNYVTSYNIIRRVTINYEGKLGIGNNLNPTQDLDVEGNIRMRTGAQAGYVAVSSSDGTMSWQPFAGAAFWQPLTGAAPGSGHIMNKDNGEVHIGNIPHQFFLAPVLGGGHYPFLSKAGDAGIFFGPISTEGDPLDETGLVIASRNQGNGGKNGLRIDFNGNVTIGAIVPSGMNTAYANTYKLSIGGSVIAELVRVKFLGNWPDFVFTENYKLLTLPELEKYISTNGHLPNVPTEKEVKEEGIDLGEMNRILLQKIEELTLYVIELEKRIEEE